MIRGAVIIPAHNAEATIPACLAGLAVQTVPRGEFEVIAVDDGSTDGTARAVEEFARREPSLSVTLLQQKRAGPAAARNRGAGEARGEILLFTDSDCVPEPDWVERMLAPFDDPGVAGAKGVYRTAQRSLVARFVQAEYESKYRRMAAFESIDFVDTYSAAFRRDLFLDEGGFDTRFRTASVEDQEFSFRLAARGHRMVFVPEAVVAHRHADTASGYFRKKFRIGYYKALLLRKHPGRVGGDTHTPGSLRFQVGLVLLLPPLAVLWLVGPLPGWVPLAALALFAGSTGPFLASCRKSPAVVAIAPIMVFLRSVALGSGLLAGLARFGRPGDPSKTIERA